MTTATVLRGRAWTFGDNVDTDQVIPAKYAIYSLDEKKLGEHAMEGVPGNDGGWSQRIAPGDIMVAGSNFGCGSSREIAPIAIRGAGVSCVIADSFARIFFRNSTKGDVYEAEPFPQFMTDLMRMGGLVPWVRKRLEEQRSGGHPAPPHP